MLRSKIHAFTAAAAPQHVSQLNPVRFRRLATPDDESVGPGGSLPETRQRRFLREFLPLLRHLVMKEVKREAERRKVELLVLPTSRAIETLRQGNDDTNDDTNAILHVTC